jgi:hypothetical protein
MTTFKRPEEHSDEDDDGLPTEREAQVPGGTRAPLCLLPRGLRQGTDSAMTEPSLKSAGQSPPPAFRPVVHRRRHNRFRRA